MTYEDKFNNLVNYLNHAFNMATEFAAMAEMTSQLNDNESELALANSRVEALRSAYLYALDLLCSETDEFDIPSVDVYECVYRIATMRNNYLSAHEDDELGAKLRYHARLCAQEQLVCSLFDMSMTDVSEMVHEMTV